MTTVEEYPVAFRGQGLPSLPSSLRHGYQNAIHYRPLQGGEPYELHRVCVLLVRCSLWNPLVAGVVESPEITTACTTSRATHGSQRGRDDYRRC